MSEHEEAATHHNGITGEPESSSDSSSDSPENSAHPIAWSIDRALHRYRDIEAVVRILGPASLTILGDMLDVTHDVLQSAQAKLDATPAGENVDDVVVAELDEAITTIDRLHESKLLQTLLTSLFLGLFSAFDAFTGNLLLAIYKKKPTLLEALNVEIPLSELLRHDSFEELKNTILLDEIEKFRRGSYVEQFAILEKRFGLQLKKFDRWTNFVELGQRRNLITHCEGIVSKQYLKVCRENDVIISDDAVEGRPLDVEVPYLIEASSVIYEVSLKLGQTLWRKIFPSESNAANKHLTETIYESLKIERWRRAILLSEFASTVQKEIREVDRLVRVINHCIALKFSDQGDKCQEHLSKEDWSASALDFRLAVAVLQNDFELASALMLQIGKKGELITQQSYHGWPLFREFRRSEHFIKAYGDIFGTSYSKDIAAEVAREEDRETQEAGKHEEPGSALRQNRPRPDLHSIKKMLG